MKKLIITAISLSVILTLSSCMMAEPSMFIIDNMSSYQIEADIITLDKSFTIKKSKSEVIAAYPQNIEMNIMIPALNYEQHISFSLDYMEKKRVTFTLDKE